MNPFRSVGARLSLALAVVVAGALAVVWVALVPSLERRLVDAKLAQLGGSRAARSRGDDVADPAEPGLRRRGSPRGRRARRRTSTPLARGARRSPIFDSAAPSASVAGRRARPGRAAGAAPIRASQTRPRRAGRRTPTPRPRSPTAPGDVLLLLARRFARHARGRRPRPAAAALVGPGRARRWRCSSATAPRRSSRAGSAGSSAPPSGSPRGDFERAGRRPRPRRARRARARRSSGCACGSPSSTTRGASSSPTPRTSCGRRSSRSAASSSCSATRSSTRRRGASSSTTMPEQVERLSKLATDLLDLSRLDAGPAAARAEPVDSPRSRERPRRRVRGGRAGGASTRSRWTSSGEASALADQRAGAADRPDPRRERAPAHAAGHAGADRRARRRRSRSRTTGPGSRPSTRSRSSSASPPRGLARLRQRPRARDRARAGGADGRHARARVRPGRTRLHARAAGCRPAFSRETSLTLRGYSPSEAVRAPHAAGSRR